MMKKLLIASIIAGSLGTVSLPSLAEVIVVRQAPPALRQERTLMRATATPGSPVTGNGNTAATNGCAAPG